MPCRATQDRWVTMESSDKIWSTGGGNDKPLQYSWCEKPMNSMKRQKDMTPEDEPPRLEGVQYATGDKWWAITNSSRKNELARQKPKWCSVVDVSGGKSKVWCCKEYYCIGIWNVRSMSQSKLDMVNQEMEWLNVNISGISELKWTGIREFNSDDHYIYYCGLEQLTRNGVALIVNKRACNSWVQPQKWQNDLGSFPRQTIQHHNNPSIIQLKKLKLTGPVKTYKTF